MRRFLSFLAGALVGGLVGAVVALLLAPAPGDELKGRIRERALRVRDEVQAAAVARRTELEKQLAALRAPRKV